MKTIVLSDEALAVVYQALVQLPYQKVHALIADIERQLAFPEPAPNKPPQEPDAKTNRDNHDV